MRVEKCIENGCGVVTINISPDLVATSMDSSYPWSPLQKMWIHCKKAIEVWGKT